ncbi:hypothetical protein NE562_14710 [Butyricicoccus faecihominis]|uniref:hypothetical protein n=1 Tax=Butyricicoccus faecihominis TaxID=1712515 RepID=UPI00247AB487|nr:hypothetical protein [Butyricicoccus faecihominis]MCQ5130914.1 hypothetical protein [Butyricicoccus faecihominis]
MKKKPTQEQQKRKRKKYEKKRYLVYEMMIGDMTFCSPQINKKFYVKDEFKEGTVCGSAYTDIYNAANNICAKLNVNEDLDVECILNSYNKITEHLCYCMYDYGALFGKKYWE